MKAYKEEKCLMCGKKAEWMRVTQFSGVHPFCLKHAKEEPDFHVKDDSYCFWEEIKDE